VLTLDFTLRDLHNVTTPTTLAHGRELAALVEALDWDEYSLWGCSGCGDRGRETPVHHTGRRLTGECPQRTPRIDSISSVRTA
jgi:hypothetical protein